MDIGESQFQVSRPNIEKDGDLPSANLSKIQALYKRILSASDNPAIIDWVKAAETKISNLERELENTGKALDVCQQTCEQYRKQVVVYFFKFSIFTLKSLLFFTRFLNMKTNSF